MFCYIKACFWIVSCVNSNWHKLNNYYKKITNPKTLPKKAIVHSGELNPIILQAFYFVIPRAIKA
jgi:hypothetical protein